MELLRKINATAAKIAFKILKFIALFAFSFIIAYFSTRVPLQGIKINSLVYYLEGCIDVTRGLPFSFDGRSVGELGRVAICDEAGVMAIRLLLILLNTLLWLAVFYIFYTLWHFVGKLILKIKNIKYYAKKS